MPDDYPPLPLTDADTPRTPELNEAFVQDIIALIDEGRRGMVLNVVTDLHPADVSRLMAHLDDPEAGVLFEWLTSDVQSALLPELEKSQRSELLEQLTAGEIIELLDRLETDDAADVLADVEGGVDFVLPHLSDSADLETLLGFAEDTAGGRMATEYVAVREDITVAEATEIVREQAELVDPVYVVYVVDDEGRLVGIVPLQRLLLAPSRTLIADITERDFLSVEPDLDQEEAAQIMERYDLVALPVVSAEGRLMGRITIDDIVDVIREEAEEDFQRASGIVAEEEYTASVFQISRGRLPWLIIGMAGAFLSGMVIQVFEGTLEQALVLATFIPLVTATGGNAAIQSAAIAVQGLNSGELWVGDAVKRLGKEVLVAFANGVVLGAALGLLVLFLQMGNPVRMALTILLTLFFVVIVATTNGALVPFLLKKMGMDPATSMGPFVTTLNDILGLTVYFIVATLVYLA